MPIPPFVGGEGGGIEVGGGDGPALGFDGSLDAISREEAVSGY
jgi:hypothetical protein